MPISSPVMSYDNVRYYAIQITALQFLDKPRDAYLSLGVVIANFQLYHAISQKRCKLTQKIGLQ